MEDKVTFLDSRGNKIAGVLCVPDKRDIKNFSVVVLCHGLNSNKNTTNYVSLADILLKNNIGSLRFDFYGHGDSDGNFEDITISEATDNILRGIEYLKQMGCRKIGLVGSSFGGIASIIAASQITDLFVLVLKSPVSNYVELESSRMSFKELELWKNDGYFDHVAFNGKKLRLKYSFMENAYINDGYNAAINITAPTLIIHGSADETVPLEQSKKLAGTIKNCVFQIIEGADHRYTDSKHNEIMLKFISNFIINNLKQWQILQRN